jgi:hypothetical protein
MTRETVSETTRTVERLQGLNWVQSVSATERDDATHRLVTNLAAVRTDHEIHTIQNMGVRPVVYSQAGDYGMVVYVEIP